MRLSRSAGAVPGRVGRGLGAGAVSGLGAHATRIKAVERIRGPVRTFSLLLCMRPVRAGELGVDLRLLGEPGSEPDPVEIGLENITTQGGRALVVPLPGRASVPLGGGTPPLGFQPRCLCSPARLGRLPFLPDGEGGGNNRAQALGYILPIAKLAAGATRHQPQAAGRIQPRSQALEQLRSLLRAQAGRACHIPPDLDPSGRSVHMLATGPARARRPILQL